MAKGLGELLTLKGVMASGEFSVDGRLVDFLSHSKVFPQDVAVLTAQFAAAVTQLFTALATAHGKISGFNWLPQQAWEYSGGDLTIVVGGNRGVFVKTAEADFDQVFAALTE